MCPNLQKYGKCKMPADKFCRFAHNAIELDLIPIATKMKNLQGVIQSSTQKMKNMKPLEPWRPVKSGEIIHSKSNYLSNIVIAHLMDMTSKNHRRRGQDDEDQHRLKEVKKKSIFERENILRKPYENNE